MDDLIKREDAIKAVMQKPAIHGSEGSWYHADDIKDALKEVPSAVRPRGEWIEDPEGDWDDADKGEYECSSCGFRMYPYISDEAFREKYKFCPNCGADMRGATDGNK